MILWAMIMLNLLDLDRCSRTDQAETSMHVMQLHIDA